ncbi:hypothetical protein ACWEQ7_22050 [Streptomyces sp. NPDC004069]
MAAFRSERYPELTFQDRRGVWARFRGGRFETSDAAVAKRLRALPAEQGITEVKAPAKAPASASGKQAEGKAPTK